MTTSQEFERGVAPVPHEPSIEDTQDLGPPLSSVPDSADVPGRRRRLWPLIAGAAAAGLLVPLLAYAVFGAGGEPAATPSQSAPPASTPVAPDGRVSLAELRDATLFIPAWPSDARFIGPSGWVEFTDGASGTLPGTGIRLYLPHSQVGYGDVDRDGARETVVTVASGNEGRSWQVLALDRNASGKIVTIGRVVATTGQIQVIKDDVGVKSDGSIQVKVGDFQVSAGEEPTVTQWQTRAYALDGDRFTQVGGQTSFPANPRVTELAVTAGAVVLGPPVRGTRHGMLRVIVAVTGPVAPDRLVLMMSLPADLGREGPAWADAEVEQVDAGTVRVYLRDVRPAPGPDGSRAYVFGLARADGAGDGDALQVFVAGRTDDNQSMGENQPDDNLVTVVIAH
jgi:hypothetical protein